MRCTLPSLIVLLAAVAHGADEAPQATGSLDGKRVSFPEKGIADGVKAAVGLLESCIDESLDDAEERKKAIQGDHIRLVFAKPITVTVMRAKIEVSELVFRRPLNTGVFWVRTGDKWQRFAKYQFEKEERSRSGSNRRNWLAENGPGLL